MATIYEPTIILKPENFTAADSARVDSFCKIESGQGVSLGEYVHIASYCHLNIGGGKLVMEYGSSMGSGAKVITGSNMIDAPSCSAVVPADEQRIERWEVTIGKNAVLFADAIACASLGEGAVLMANAFLKRDTPIPAFEIWGGTPARKIGERIAIPPQEVLVKWDEYFSWHCKMLKVSPPVSPMYRTELVQNEQLTVGFVKVWGLTRDKKDKAVEIPLEFVELI